MFKPHPDAEARRRSAITLIKAIVPLDLYEKHKRKFLRNCLCKLTEAEGGKGRRRKRKYNLRFVSSEAEHACESELRHEHVYRCKPMVDLLMRANLENIDEIIANAIGCTVTKAEHKEGSTCSCVRREYGAYPTSSWRDRCNAYSFRRKYRRFRNPYA